jgi:cytochrome c553
MPRAPVTEHRPPPTCSATMASAHRLLFVCLVFVVGCGGPVAAPSQPAGELIAHGGGPGGPGDACFTCHGFNGEGDGRTPRLAGLDAGYIAKQLADYAHQTRPDVVMTPIARRMSDGDRRAVAAYYAAMQAPPPRAPRTTLALYHTGDRARGIRRCVNCHGETGEGEGPANPAIAGQPTAYTVEQLQRWKRGERRNDARDVMGQAARGMSDEEIEAIAAYVEQMR